MSVPTLFILDLKIITEIIALGLLCTTLIFFPLNDWMTNKWTTIITDWHLSSCKKQSCRSPISWNITNIFQACYFGYFGHAWRRLPKMIVLTLKQTTILIYKKKINFTLSSLLRYYTFYTLKNPEIVLPKNILVHNQRTKILPDMGLAVKYQDQCDFSF